MFKNTLMGGSERDLSAVEYRNR